MRTRKDKINSRLVVFWRTLKLTVHDSVQDNIFKLSAALSYYAVFSLVPMLLIVFWISGMFYESAYIKGQFYGIVSQFVGQNTVGEIDKVLSNMSIDHASKWTKVLGIVTLVLSSTGMFGEIQNSINHIWGLRVNPKKGFARVLVSRLISFSIVISLGVLLVVSLLVNAVLGIALNKLRSYFPGIPIETLYMLDQVLIFILIYSLFLAIFRVLPDAKMKVRDVSGSALFTAVLFYIGKVAIGYVLANNVAVNAYGSASSVIIILLWFYYSAIIMYIGAEFAQASIKVKGKHIRPNKFAVWVEEKHVVVQSNTEVVKEDLEEAQKDQLPG